MTKRSDYGGRWTYTLLNWTDLISLVNDYLSHILIIPNIVFLEITRGISNTIKRITEDNFKV